MAFDPRDFQSHIARYNFALSYCAKKIVLDAGCGTGYGTMMLSWVAESVLGVDYDGDAIEYARQKYSTPRTVFKVQDVVEMDLPDDVFDVVVAFEIVEHIREPRDFLNEIVRVLKPGGLLVISAPHASWSKLHFRDYTAAALWNLVREFFPEQNITYYCQGPRTNFYEKDQIEEPVRTHLTVAYTVVP